MEITGDASAAYLAAWMGNATAGVNAARLRRDVLAWASSSKARMRLRIAGMLRPRVRAAVALPQPRRAARRVHRSVRPSRAASSSPGRLGGPA